MRKFLIASFLVAIASLFSQINADRESAVVGCYYNANTNVRNGDGAFYSSHIDPKLCTHLYYGYFGINEDGSVVSVNKNPDRLWSKSYGGIYEAIRLKKVNKNLKVLLSIGGPNVRSELFSSIAADFEKRQKIVDSAMVVVNWHGFDGVDIKWEFPSKSDSANFKQLLREMNGSLKEKQKLLAVTVAASAFTYLQETPYYNPVHVDSHCDLINVMAYEFASALDKQASFNAPLLGTGTKNIDYAVGTWNSGASSRKICLGLPLHGRSFTLENSANNQPGAAVTGPGHPGPYRQEAGVLSYNEICENLQNGWQRAFNVQQSAPFAFKGDQWVSYDDAESLSHKIQYIKSHLLGGAYVYALDEDDFRGKCGPKYPLLSHIYNSFNRKRSIVDSIKDLFG